ncbi:M15 family metallopeptidase [Serratia proteamaculans]|uniref:M15 family peptidase n=1 Tax=Serratia proteamaculans TaxID=28151 RepID=A0A5Q2VEP9_SERPR|nr:M15 family metallopeptidase [Serratia proteamaculans]QGH62041.1 M15 family peptidase [Serratia proteamaculans]
MKEFIFSHRSNTHLRDVHPDLKKVITLALTLSPVDFCVIEGIRTAARQSELVLNGKSKTYNSRHLTGHAVDLVPMIDGDIPWQDWRQFERIAEAVYKAAEILRIPVSWGGNWKTFKDGVHYELPRSIYP